MRRCSSSAYFLEVRFGLVIYPAPSAGLHRGLALLCVLPRLPGRGQNVIDTATVLWLVVGYFGTWGSGYSIGKAVAWTRAIRGAV